MCVRKNERNSFDLLRRCNEKSVKHNAHSSYHYIPAIPAENP